MVRTGQLILSGVCVLVGLVIVQAVALADEPLEETENAKIVIYRTQRFAFANRPIITVNGEPVGLLIPRKSIEVAVKPGLVSASARGPVPPSTFTAENLEQLRAHIGDTESDVEFRAEAGKTYYLRGKIVFGPVGRLTRMKPDEGEKQSKNLKRIECDFGILDQIEKAAQDGLQFSAGGGARDLFCPNP